MKYSNFHLFNINQTFIFQDHKSNLASNSSLSMRLLNPQTNFTNASMNYSLMG